MSNYALFSTKEINELYDRWGKELPRLYKEANSKAVDLVGADLKEPNPPLYYKEKIG